jgi:uncharacterized protein YgiM (DUF1202 family)
MKKLVLTLAILVQAVFVFADNRKEAQVVKAKSENVKVYRQAGTAAEVVQSLATSDTVAYIRKFNDNWSIVQINGEVGYVLTTELVSVDAAPAITAKTKKTDRKKVAAL